MTSWCTQVGIRRNSSGWFRVSWGKWKLYAKGKNVCPCSQRCSLNSSFPAPFPGYSCQTSEEAHEVTVIFPQREWAHNYYELKCVVSWGKVCYHADGKAAVRCSSEGKQPRWATDRKEVGQWQSGSKAGKLESSRSAGQNGVSPAYRNCWSKWCQTGSFSLLTSAFLSPWGAAVGMGHRMGQPGLGAAQSCKGGWWVPLAHLLTQPSCQEGFQIIHRVVLSCLKRSRMRLHGLRKQVLAQLLVSLA